MCGRYRLLALQLHLLSSRLDRCLHRMLQSVCRVGSAGIESRRLVPVSLICALLHCCLECGRCCGLGLLGRFLSCCLHRSLCCSLCRRRLRNGSLRCLRRCRELNAQFSYCARLRRHLCLRRLDCLCAHGCLMLQAQRVCACRGALLLLAPEHVPQAKALQRHAPECDAKNLDRAVLGGIVIILCEATLVVQVGEQHHPARRRYDHCRHGHESTRRASEMGFFDDRRRI